MRGHTYRRTKPDGTLSRWNAVIDLPREPNGRRRQATRTFDTLREAQAWLARTSAETAGTAGTNSPLLTGSWLDTWLTDRSLMRGSTRATARGHLDRHLIPAVGDIPLRNLSARHVDELVRALLAKGLAPATVIRVLATLHSALACAGREGVLGANPATGVRVPSQPGRIPLVWSADDARRFLRDCGDDTLAALFRVALMTGMRRSELLGLLWEDVNASEELLWVRRTRVAVGARVLQGSPKSRAGTRVVHMAPSTVVTLRDLRERSSRDVGAVFANPWGQPLVPGRVSREFTRRSADLGLPAIRFHDLRHTSATLGLASGESLKEISVRLGHADISVTAGVYARVPAALAQASAGRLADYLAARTQPSDIGGAA